MLSRYVLFLQSVFRDCEWPVALADIPIKVIVKMFTNCHKLSIKIFCFAIQMEDAIYGDNNPSFGHFTAPAIISLLVDFCNKFKLLLPT